MNEMLLEEPPDIVDVLEDAPPPETEDDQVDPQLVQYYIMFAEDIRQASANLGLAEVRYLVDAYANIQNDRKRYGNQIRSVSEGEPIELLKTFFTGAKYMEGVISRVLHKWVKGQPAGVWAMSNPGIGPIIAAGLLAHVDVTRAPTAGAVWRFAGLDPSAKWEKGEKRPYNQRLKTLLWHAGECFKRMSKNPKCFYGAIYRKRKEQEVERNLNREFADQARHKLENFKIGKGTEAYKWYVKDMLPPGRLDLRATRVARKLFLSHFWEVLYFYHYGERGPQPWVLSHGGHAHYIEPPNAPWA